MRVLKNTLYINQEDVYLSLDGETVVVKREKEVLIKVPLHNLESIISHGYNGASPKLMQKCARENIKLVFLDSFGRFLARVEGETKGSVHLRVLQVEKRADERFSLGISKNFILAKVYNSRWILERAIREYSMRMDVEPIRAVSDYLYRILSKIQGCSHLEELRAVMVDRFVLSMINKKVVKPSNFEIQDTGAVILKEEARKTLLQQWQNKKNEELTHPYLKEKMKWGLVPYSQAMLLSKYLREELDEYPAFLWK